MTSRDKPRVVWVTPGSFPVPYAGSSSVERVVAEVSRRLAPYAEVTVVGRLGAGQARSETIDGVAYRRVPRMRPLAYAKAAAAIVRRLAPDVVIAENRPRLARELKRRCPPGCKVWLSLQSTTFVAPHHIGRAELRACFKSADRIVANSDFLRRRLAALVPSAAGKIAVNHLGVDPDAFPSRWDDPQALEREELLASHGATGRKVLLYVGRLQPYKGVHHLLEAMPAVAAAHPDALLFVVGGAYYGSRRTSAYSRRLQRMARRLRGHVRFVPYEPHDRVARWFRAADIAVVPSSAREAFGLVNAEAMASGVPVVATNAGGIGEVVAHGETGLLVPLRNVPDGLAAAVSELLRDPERMRAYGEAGRRRALTFFTWQATAMRLAAMLGVGV